MEVSIDPGAHASSLARDLQRRVTAFYAGDELHSAEWLASFQRLNGAWQVCVEALSMGHPTCCDEELLQEFCAQTLARLARAFPSYHAEEMRKAARDSLQELLLLHASGKFPIVWKQLALALACADLWLGCWSASPALAAGLPPAVQREMLSAPAELLFSERALPLGEGPLRQAAASALQSASQPVLHFLVGGHGGEAGPSLRLVASWLKSLRKSFGWLPGCSEVTPLQALAVRGQDFLAMVSAAPTDACEVAQQLVRWPGCDQELAQLLAPVLQELFSAPLAEESSLRAQLPLIADLAADRWPRAALGQFGLDWQAVTQRAFEVLQQAAEKADPDSGDVEAALAVWQTFATTVHEAAESSPEQRPRERRPGEEPPEKRSKHKQAWRLSREQMAQDRALPVLLQLVMQQFTNLLRAPPWPTADDLMALWDVREAAQPAIEAWALLAGDAPETQEWREAAWSPLRCVGELLALNGNDPAGAVDEDTWRETEVVLWLSAALATAWPRTGELAQVAQLALRLTPLDCAPNPWRVLLWSSACALASVAPSEQCALAVDWMLQRSPTATGAHESVLEVTELPFAQAVSRACKQLPRGEVHASLGERLFQLAFARWPPSAFSEDTLKSQSLLLTSVRHTIGGDAALLCRSLAQKVVPQLRQAVDAEAQAAPQESEPHWRAAQVLFSTLLALSPVDAPTTDAMHPAVLVWRELWSYVEAALLHWPVSDATEQPTKAAAEAVAEATRCLPALLPDALRLLAGSVAEHELPDVQLGALCQVATGVPCPPVNSTVAADMLVGTVADVMGALLSRRQALLDSPSTLEAAFALLAGVIRPSPADMVGVGPCEDKLRPQVLARPQLTSQCLELVCEALPECTSESAAVAMARYSKRLFEGDDLRSDGHRGAVLGALPLLCSALCRALASQEVLGEPEPLAAIAEVFLAASKATPAEYSAAMAVAFGQTLIGEHGRAQMLSHVAGRGEWASEENWMEQFAKLVGEWRSEKRRLEL